MGSDERYYWRRACEEMHAASRAITPAGRSRHGELVRLFVKRLADMGAPSPFSEEDLTAGLSPQVVIGAEIPAFRWNPPKQLRPRRVADAPRGRRTFS